MFEILHNTTIQTGDSELLSVRWSLEDNLLTAASTDGTIKVYNTKDRLLSSLICYEELPFPVTSVRWRPVTSSKTRNILAGTSCDGNIFHFHVSSGKMVYMSRTDTGILSSDYSANGLYFTVGCQNGSVKLYDENTKSLITDFNNDCRGVYHSARVMCVKWDTCNTFWTGGWDKNLICWDLRTNRSAKNIFGPKICGEAIDCVNDWIITGSYEINNQLNYWDVRTCKNINSVDIGEEGDKCLVYSLQVNKNSEKNILAVSGLGRSSVYFFDLTTGSVEGIISSIYKPVYSLDFSHSQSSLALSSGDGSIRVFSY
jgi:WD40 repeat protein